MHRLGNHSIKWLAPSASFLLLSLTPCAHAGYTVIDDDLLPTAALEAPRVQRRLVTPNHYAVQFSKDTSALTEAARMALDTVIPGMGGASVRIVGRPDAIYYARGKATALPRNRAEAIRAYLVRAGVPERNIAVDTDTQPNPQQNGYGYPSDIYITRQEARNYESGVSYEPVRTPVRPEPVAYEAARQVQPAQLANPADATKRQLFQYINQAVASGQMDPGVALKILRAQMESEPVTGYRNAAYPDPQPYAAVPKLAAVMPAITSQPVAIAVIAQTKEWVLDKSMTLRANIDAWSKASGWNPVIWDAANFYQVTTTSTVEGDFPGVLRQVAESTGLHICAKNHEKTVRVTDANVACK